MDGDFGAVTGEVSLERDGNPLWRKVIETGEENMSHTLANLEHHHFKFAGHRRPHHVHVHLFGAHSLSFRGVWARPAQPDRDRTERAGTIDPSSAPGLNESPSDIRRI